MKQNSQLNKFFSGNVGFIECMKITPAASRRLVRFGLTGLLVTGLHFIVAVLFIEYVIPNPPLANGVAFSLATITSYLINTTWSFSGKLYGQTLFRFMAVSTIGLFLAISVSWVIQWLGFGYLAGICAVAITVPPMTFILHNSWTYR